MAMTKEWFHIVQHAADASPVDDHDIQIWQKCKDLFCIFLVH